MRRTLSYKPHPFEGVVFQYPHPIVGPAHCPPLRPATIWIVARMLTASVYPRSAIRRRGLRGGICVARGAGYNALMPIRPRTLLLLILAVYALLGVLYAVYTPAWQAPDEPAHYNYIRYLAEQGDFPVLHPGDYPSTFLEEIKGRHFPPDLSIDPIRYEFHQPPLYYALLAPLFALTGGALLPLRLASVLLGLGIVWLAYLVVRQIFPDRPGLALGTAAFVAFLPQHLVTASQVGNDVLAELWVALVLFELVRWATTPAAVTGAGQEAGWRRLPLWRLGLWSGLALITKTTAYVAVLLLAAVLVGEAWRRRDAWRALAPLSSAALPALLLALPWYARDLSVYGWPDFLGLIRHDTVVTGQLRTAAHIGELGWPAYLSEFVATTFRSFWGVFGWMGVPMDGRVYQALGLLCGLAAAGLVGHEIRSRRRPALGRGQRLALRLLAASAVITLLTYLWYNAQFVQYQGRYLFTALIPLGLAFGLGWEEALQQRSSRWLAGLLLVASVAMALAARLGGQRLPAWPLALALGGAVGLAVLPWLPRALGRWLWALPYLLLPLLALYGLFGALVPQLAG